MPRPAKRVLLLTNAEHVQAGVFLATAHALLQLGAEVHLASFPALEPAVRALSPAVVFHPVRGPDMHTACLEDHLQTVGGGPSSLTSTLVRAWRGRPSLATAPVVLRLCLACALPWSGPQFLDIYRSVLGVLDHVRPDRIAVDPAFAPALSACAHARRGFVVLAPNTIKDFAMLFQPAGEVFWKYPCLPSAIPFPIPWHLVLLNACYVLVFVAAYCLDHHRREVRRYVHAHTGLPMVGLDDLSRGPPRGVRYLVANLPELEFPLRTIPRHIVPCGPIVLPAATSVSETDPALAAWLARGPTVYVCRGDRTAGSSPETVVEIARAVRMALSQDQRRQQQQQQQQQQAQSGSNGPSLQVLWETGDEDEEEDDEIHLRQVLAPEMEVDVVRTVRTTSSSPSPPPALAHRSVVAVLHPGDPPSFLAAVARGRPQLVLPTRLDAFDAARRAELLGVGVWGNRAAAPRCRADEVAASLARVVGAGTEEEGRMRRRAEELAALCRRDPGRMVAARAILAGI